MPAEAQATPTPEAFFYHLERQPLERVLPSLVERSLERGWRALVRVGSPERLDALDAHLWTYRDDSFLPHGTVKDGFLARQPVVLTLDDGNPNKAQVLFIVDGAEVPERAALQGFTRLVMIFDGAEEDALQAARDAWTRLKSDGFPVTYWQHDDQGRWVKKA